MLKILPLDFRLDSREDVVFLVIVGKREEAKRPPRSSGRLSFIFKYTGFPHFPGASRAFPHFLASSVSFYVGCEIPGI